MPRSWAAIHFTLQMLQSVFFAFYLTKRKEKNASKHLQCQTDRVYIRRKLRCKTAIYLTLQNTSKRFSSFVLIKKEGEERLEVASGSRPKNLDAT